MKDLKRSVRISLGFQPKCVDQVLLGQDGQATEVRDLDRVGYGTVLAAPTPPELRTSLKLFDFVSALPFVSQVAGLANTDCCNGRTPLYEIAAVATAPSQ